MGSIDWEVIKNSNAKLSILQRAIRFKYVYRRAMTEQREQNIYFKNTGNFKTCEQNTGGGFTYSDVNHKEQKQNKRTFWNLQRTNC